MLSLVVIAVGVFSQSIPVLSISDSLALLDEKRQERLSFVCTPNLSVAPEQVTIVTTDVAVEQVKMRPESPTHGMRVDFIAILLNSGPPVSVNTTFYVDEKSIYSQMSNLIFRGYEKLLASWTAVRGRHMLRVKTEALNVTDTNPENDELMLLVNIAVPVYEFTAVIDATLKFGKTALSVDGALVGRLSGGDAKTLTFEVGTVHNITIESVVRPLQGYRFIASNSSIKVYSGGEHVFSYRAEYFLSVAVRPLIALEITGSGWKTQGETVALSAPASVPGKKEGVRYDLVEWTLDGGSPLSQAVIQVFMDGPHSATALYRVLYLVRVLDERKIAKVPGNDTYYDEGSNIDLVATPSTRSLDDFWGWLFGGKENAVISPIRNLSDSTTLYVSWTAEDHGVILAHAISDATTIVKGVIAILSLIFGAVANQRCWISRLMELLQKIRKKLESAHGKSGRRQ